MRQEEVERLSPRTFFLLSALLIVTFCSSLWLFTRANRGSYLYHPDEPEKTFQIYRNYRNHRHPQLLLEVSQSAARVFQTPAEPQATVVVGRNVAAAFAASAVTVLTLLGFVLGGFTGAVAAAVLVGTSPFLLVNAHYMKEDTALVMGLAMVTLALVQLARLKTPARRFCAAGLLGFSCAVAASGKYVGLLALVPAVTMIVAPRPRLGRETWARLGVFTLCFALLLLAINHRLVFELATFTSAMKYHGATPLLGHGGTKMAWPSGYYPRVIHQLAGAHVELLALAAAAVLLTVPRRKSLPHAIPILLALACAALLLLCRSAFPRYALPAIVLLTAAAALGIAWTAQLWPARWRCREAWALALVAVCWSIQWRACTSYIGQLRDDSRDRLRAWMATNLPPTARVAADTYAGRFWAFGGEQALTVWPGVRVHAAPSAADLGALSALRAEGFTHVAVSAAAYDRYFDPHLRPLPQAQRDFARRRAWYQELFHGAELVWRSDPERDTMAYTNPPLRLYRLRKIAHESHESARREASAN